LATIAHKLSLPTFAALNTPYPERPEKDETVYARLSQRLDASIALKSSAWRRPSFLQQFATLRKQAVADPSQLPLIKRALRSGRLLEFSDASIAIAFAHIAAVLFAQKGIELRTTQLLAARGMLQGRLIEMATGEGKTFSAMLAAATAALAGIPVHVMTSNEYLATRDEASLRPVFAALGLASAVITHDMQTDERRENYEHPIVYCTSTEVIFDYLKDRLAGVGKTALNARLQRIATHNVAAKPILKGLCFALIDEADSILIDQASTPFILAAAVAKNDSKQAQVALQLASQLQKNSDYTLQISNKKAELSLTGQKKLERISEGMQGLWSCNTRFREELVCLAISALHCFEKDVDYVVAQDSIQIIDANSGRIAQGRQWSKGLHQLIEAKESVSASQEQRTIIQLTYQRFFPRYLMLGGMSGTLKESAHELRETYGLSIETVNPFTKSLRKNLPAQLYFEQRTLDRHLLHLIQSNHKSKRPILIGTDSVEDSLRVSQLLTEHRLAHKLLNAVKHAEEADIIRQAGYQEQITVTTNMAGRGTDITLGPGVSALGGLLVISCQSNSSNRIDRQLSGRCGRRGDPGSALTLLNVQRGLLGKAASRKIWAFLKPLASANGFLPVRLGEYLLRKCQFVSEKKAMKLRRAMMQSDAAIEKRLSFGGRKD
jgi:preprotein translocase subunit SecA